MPRKGQRRQIKRKKKWTTKLCDFLRALTAFIFSKIGVVLLMIGYTIAGAFIFMDIEGPYFVNKKEIVLKYREDTVKRLWKTIEEINVFSEEEWEEKIGRIYLEFQRNITSFVISDGYAGEEMSGNKWTFSGSFLYSLTVITSIGYGHIVPETYMGKLMTFFYAMIGMPLFLLYLTNIGSVFAACFKWTYSKLFLCSCTAEVKRSRESRERSASRAHMGMNIEFEDFLDSPCASIGDEMSSGGSDEESEKTVSVPVSLCIMVMISYIVGGAFLFAKWEDMSILDGTYFCFISLSTIGFGDIVPGNLISTDTATEARFISCAIYLLFGMALIGMCFNLMQEEVVGKFKRLKTKFLKLFQCKSRKSN